MISSANPRGAGRAMPPRARRGLTLPELLITIVIVMIVGAAFMRIMVYQSRFFDEQGANRQARSVSRGALNALLSELRMVAVPGGILSATPDRVVARVPYALGIFCGSTAGGSSISILPTDSLTYSESGTAGYAWRDSTGNYTYQSASFTLAPGLAADCAARSITTVPGGRVVTVQPVVHASATIGTPIFLYRRIQYDFRNSAVLSGRRALWRTNLVTGTSEELIAPFESTARFRFYVNGLIDPQDAAPMVIGELRGLELYLYGESDNPVRSTSAPKTAELQTAVFFMNRAP